MQLFSNTSDGSKSTIFGKVKKGVLGMLTIAVLSSSLSANNISSVNPINNLQNGTSVVLHLEYEGQNYSIKLTQNFDEKITYSVVEETKAVYKDSNKRIRQVAGGVGGVVIGNQMGSKKDAAKVILGVGGIIVGDQVFKPDPNDPNNYELVTEKVRVANTTITPSVLISGYGSTERPLQINNMSINDIIYIYNRGNLNIERANQRTIYSKEKVTTLKEVPVDKSNIINGKSIIPTVGRVGGGVLGHEVMRKNGGNDLEKIVRGGVGAIVGTVGGRIVDGIIKGNQAKNTPATMLMEVTEYKVVPSTKTDLTISMPNPRSNREGSKVFYTVKDVGNSEYPPYYTTNVNVTSNNVPPTKTINSQEAQKILGLNY